MAKIERQIEVELPMETWMETAEIIKQIGFEVAEGVKKANVKDNGNEDAEAVIARFQLAYMAINHVAMFARDKCRIVVTHDGPLI